MSEMASKMANFEKEKKFDGFKFWTHVIGYYSIIFFLRTSCDEPRSTCFHSRKSCFHFHIGGLTVTIFDLTVIPLDKTVDMVTRWLFLTNHRRFRNSSITSYSKSKVLRRFSDVWYPDSGFLT